MLFTLRRLIFPVAILLCLSSEAQYHFNFSKGCADAYHKIISLQLEPGRKMLEAEKIKDPHNLIPGLLESYIDFFYLFFNEDPELYASFKQKQQQRQLMIDKGPDDSPYKLYARSVVNMHLAAAQIKFGNHWDAGWSFRRYYLNNKSNLNKFPGFTPSALHLGTMEVAIGAVPDGYKWVTSLLGLKGEIAAGMQKIEDFISGNSPENLLFRNEAIFYYLYLKFYIQNDKQGVLNYIKNNHLDIVNNHLFAYLAANLSINSQQSAQAGAIIRNRNRSADYINTPVWDFEYGYVRLSHLEADAGIYFERFIRDFKGNFYLKDAIQKLSWHYYLQGDMKKAAYYRKMIAEKGTQMTEADKQAHKEAMSDKWPNKILLQVRLLNDGGYLREALGKLNGMSVDDFPVIEEKLEFSYRVGRLFDDLGRAAESIQYYEYVAAAGANRKEYYAARAALQLGYIYEKKKDWENAKNWFQKCLAMKNHDYKNSIDSRAKAGLARIDAR